MFREGATLTRLLQHIDADASQSGIPNSSAAPRKLLSSTVLRDSANYLLSKVVPGAIGLLSVIVFVRLVGYAEYGRYAVLFAVSTAFASGFSGWLSQGTLRFHSKYNAPADFRSFLHATQVGILLSTTTGGVVLAIVLWVSDGLAGWATLVSVGFSSAMLVYTVVIAQFQASLRSKTVLLYESIRSVASLAIPAALVLAFHSKDHRLLLLGMLLGYLLPLSLRALSARGESSTSRVSWSPVLPQRERAFLNEVWRYGWPVGLWLLCQQGLVVSDRYFIQKFAGYSAAGIYASMYDLIVRSFSLVFAPITLAIHPLVMHHWNRGEQADSLHVLRSGLRLQVYLFLPLGVLLFIASSRLTRLTLGQPNQEAASIVLPLALGGFLWQLALLAHKPLEILCQTRRMLAGMLTALLINICGNYLLIPRFGFPAAAYLTVLSSLAYLLVLRIVSPKRFPVEDDAASGSAPPALSIPVQVNTRQAPSDD